MEKLRKVNTQKLSLWAFCLVIGCFITTNAWSTDYYFSSVNGSDFNSGTSPSQAWKSISKLNSIIPQLQPGDNVFLEKGSVWYQSKINMNNIDGSQGSPIVFSTYGTGKIPRISGAKNVSGSFEKNGDEWYINNINYTLSGYLRANAGLLINGAYNDISRYPNDGTWWKTRSTGKTSLSDPEQNWQDGEWVGSNVVARCVPYGVEISEITSNSSSEMSFESFKYYSLRQSTNPTSYYISNSNKGLSEDGEWTYRNGTLRVKYSSNLNDKLVEFPVVDTIFKISESDYVVFDGIHFENANAVIVHLNKSNNISFKNCTIRVAGHSGIRAKSSLDLTLQNNYFEYLHDNGVIMDNSSSTILENAFKHISAVWGHNNTNGDDNRSGAAITPWYSEGFNIIKYNTFDSIDQALNSHWNNESWYFERNIVNTYGVTRGGDIGAVYTGGDWRADVPKYVRKNIFINGVQDLTTIAGGHSTRYTHMVYWDYSSRGIIVDSNTVHGVSVALYSNCSEYNRFQDNLIVDPTRDLDDFWGSVFYFDASGDNTGCDGISDNTITRNTVVFSDNNGQIGTIWRTDGDAWFPNFTFNNNTYQNPFNNTITPHRKVEGFYTKKEDYTMSSMCSSNNWDCNSIWQPLNHTYENTSGISKDEFVQVFYNASKQKRDIAIPDKYIDLEGNYHENFVTLEPYSSIVLFYYDKNENANAKPVINNHQFDIYEKDGFIETIGIVDASDADQGQSLSYAISSGNADELFTIDSEGTISFTTENINYANNPSYELTITVSDNGNPSLSSDAKIIINLISEDEVIVIRNNKPIIENQMFDVYSSDLSSNVVGTVLASDADVDQSLNYFIISGNEQEYFEIGQNDGSLVITNQERIYDSNEKIILNVMVEDNHDTPMADTAQISINFISSHSLYYIDPENSNDPFKDGTIEHPYTDFESLPTLKQNAQILLKRGTTLKADQLVIPANSVTITDYGIGDKPVIESNTTDHVIKAINKKDILIRNIQINAENAISSIYFSGNQCENNTVECCHLTGSEYGVRIMDAISYNILYSTFENRTDAIYSISNFANIYYNIFKGANTAVNLGSNSIAAHVFNNVFVNNRKGISSISAEIVLYNNIFQLNDNGDLAISHDYDKIVSDHNIFYPDRQNFVQINGNQYSSIHEIQNKYGFDLNSMNVDPQFVDADNNNYELTQTSPAIDAGKYVGIFKDYLGDAVPFGKKPDIGCKESKNTAKTIVDDDQTTNADLVNDKKEVHFVYPNPNNGSFTVSHNELAKFNTLKILNLSGQVIFEQQIDKFQISDMKINLFDLKDGIYFIQLTGETLSVTDKMIVN